MSERYVITLEALPKRPGAARVPAEVQLRQLLKLALRGLSLRCVDVRTRKPAPAKEPT